jgi:PASTA domain-containing protein
LRACGRIAVVLAAGATFALAAAGTASANKSTIGSALDQPFDSNSCTLGCVAVQQSQASGSPNPLTSPVNGIVTQWAVRSGDAGAIYSLRILRPAGANTYSGAGTATAPTSDPGSLNAILVYPTSLPISKGDAIGVTEAGDADAGIPQHDTPGVTANVMATSSPQPADGATALFTPTAEHELLLQATVSFCFVPNVHKLKKVNAKKLLTAADCGVKVKKKKTKKKKFRGKVLKQKKPPGTTADPGTVVPIVIGQK